MFSYLYIASEYTHERTIVDPNGDHDSLDNVKYVRKKSSDYSKIGITSNKPWERLRKLQQGNPRGLQFSHLWIGLAWHVKYCEKKIKDDGGEWKSYDSDTMKSLVEEEINRNNYDLHYVTMCNLLPYSETSYGFCKLHKIDDDLVYSACKIAKGKYFYVSSNGELYLVNDNGKLERVDEKISD